MCVVHFPGVKLTGSQKQDGINIPVQRRLLVHGYLHVVDAPLEHERPHPYWVHLVRHQWVPSGKREDIVREVSG